MTLPLLVVTGSSGFVGRHLLELLAPDYRIVGIARRSQVRSGALVHPNLTWHQADVADRDALRPVFEELRGEPVHALLHLAAHYDFTGEEDPEYWRTNVVGTRNVLDLSKELQLGRFIFSSSIAASRLPPRGSALDEDSPPDGEHIYARTKAEGERMVKSGPHPHHVLRFAALFSDWCEYAPLFVFLTTWLGTGWTARILGGRGESSVPLLHVQDNALFIAKLLRSFDRVPPGTTLVPAMDGSVTHGELYAEATREFYKRAVRPIHMPRALCGPGMWARDVLGRVLGERPFERPWMARYIDLRMDVDASRTRALLDWAPRDRLHVLRRLPFMLEHMRHDPLEWNRLNRAAMKQVHLRENLRIYRLLQKHELEISHEFTAVLRREPDRFPSYQRLSADEHHWNHRTTLRHLMNAVLTRERTVFTTFCRDLAERRSTQGYAGDEVCEALRVLNRTCFKVLRRDPESEGLREALLDHVTMTLRIGCDQAQDVFERLATLGGHRTLTAREHEPVEQR